MRIKSICFSGFLAGLIILIAVGCGTEVNILPASTGKTAELLVVADKNVFNGPVGDQIKDVFAREIELLPQIEPLFNVVNIPHTSFEGMFRTFRNVFIISVDPKLSEATLDVKYDVWAQPQAVIKISAPSDTTFIRLLKEHGNVFCSRYLEMERKRMINAFKGIESPGVRTALVKNFGFGMIFPDGYYIATQNDDFAWVRKETESTSQYVIIHTRPFQDNSVFETQKILDLRDTLTRKYIPGPSEGSYMTIEKEIAPVSKDINFKGKYAVETRGLWRLGGGCCMGGPFINYTFVDDSNQKVISVDVSVYAPGFKKRDYLLQVESIVYSLEFVK